VSQIRYHRTVVLFLLVLVAAVGCGKKGPPRAPIRIVPTEPTEFEARRLGAEVYLQFDVPATNTDDTALADLDTVEVYSITLGPLPEGVSPLTDEEFIEAATLVATINVRPPAELDLAELPPPVDGTLLELPAPGATVAVREVLTAEMLRSADLSDVDRRFDIDEDNEDDAEVPVVTGLRWVETPAAFPFLPERPRRTYVAVGLTADGDYGNMSTELGVRLDAAPSAPGPPEVSYTVDVATITWLPAPNAMRAVQAPALDLSALEATAPELPVLLESTPTIASAEPMTYNVYTYNPRAAVPADGDVVMPIPVNAVPLETFELSDANVEFGVERCYIVTAISTVDGDPIESEASSPTCAEFRDTFAPAAARNLAAVGSLGAVSLIWEPNSEADLAGYLVLRGESPDGTLVPLMTVPLTETNYRDTTGTTGVTYVYAVVAADGAAPPNISELSNRVTESPQ